MKGHGNGSVLDGFRRRLGVLLGALGPRRSVLAAVKSRAGQGAGTQGAARGGVSGARRNAVQLPPLTTRDGWTGPGPVLHEPAPGRGPVACEEGLTPT
ncbi:hypothetical protein SEA_COLT_4 [Mycobacterium phage Colt]|nr:hypothetical protein SEA_COLT_4 [Mycobacterium phage Colt]